MARHNVAENAEYRRNYKRLKYQVWEIQQSFSPGGGAIGDAIYRLVRERFGSRATEIGDADIEAAAEFVKALARLAGAVRSGTQHMIEEEQKRQQQSRAQRRDDWMSVVQMLQGSTRPQREAPQLRLVPDCGRDLETT